MLNKRKNPGIDSDEKLTIIQSPIMIDVADNKWLKLQDGDFDFNKIETTYPENITNRFLTDYSVTLCAQQDNARIKYGTRVCKFRNQSIIYIYKNFLHYRSHDLIEDFDIITGK